MKLSFTLSELAQAANGRIASGPENAFIQCISTDSRKIAPGDWFLALRGENFDGHAFAAQVLENGAGGLILAADAPQARQLPASANVLLVEDTLRALGDIAHAWRKRINPLMACIAGSNGKTTTKDIAACTLASREDALASKGNFNNLIGLPSTILEILPTHKMLLAELGMNTAGELQRLTQIADPDVAALTNIGEAHVGQFGSIEGLIRAKGELIRSMRPGARLVANADCEKSRSAVKQWGGHLAITWFGSNGGAWRAENIEAIEPWGYAFDLIAPEGRARVRLQAYGRHNVGNAVCAAALLHEMGFGLNSIAEGIERFRPASMRSLARVIHGVTIIEDCYNASPSAMLAALDSLKDLQVSGMHHLVLGDMLELGEAEEQFHRTVGEAAAQLPRVRLYCVGPRAQWIAQSASNQSAQADTFESADDAAVALLPNVKPGDAVLIKGSRRMKLEMVAQALQAHLEQQF